MDAPDPGWAELRTLVADAWRARSPDERQAAGSVLAEPDTVASDESAQATKAEAVPEWGAPDAGLVLAPAGMPFELPGAVRHALDAETIPTERSARTADDPIDSAAVDAALGRVEALAALSGAVTPGDLVAELDPALGREVLDRLASYCDRTLVDAADNRWSWVMTAGRRRAVLAALDRRARDAALAQADRVATDAAGRLLRAIAGGDHAIGGGSALKDRVQALAWAQPLDPALAAPLADARRAAEIGSLLAGYDQLLADGFVGRERQVARLRAFIDEPPVDDDIHVLGVSGIGGAGKSTLLAYVLRDLAATAVGRDDQPIVIAIDFDRQRFIEGGELEWSFELTRQLGLFAPDIAEPLTALRAGVRDARSRRGEDGKDVDAAQESAVRGGQEVLWACAQTPEWAHHRGRRMVLAVDTFEEWHRSVWNPWGSPAHRVLEWAAEVGRHLGLTMRLIVSGRAPVALPGFQAAADPIELGDLAHAEAVALLEGLDIEPAAAKAIARIVGGNPLALKLAALHYLKLPPERRASFLGDDGENLAGLDAALRQGVLYRRLLDHIPDPDVRKLAHPGLALREVTPALIRGVLAGPCDLGDISETRAEELAEKLEREAWLVERQGDTLVHRADVRRMALRHMAADPEQGPRVRAVHEAAAAWFGDDPHPDPVDAAYHRLAMTDPGAIADDPIDTDILWRLAPALDDFDPRVAAALRDRLGLRLTAAAAALLPEERRRAWTRQRAADLVERGQASGALRFWHKGGYAPAAEPWYVQAAFQAPDWGLAVPFADDTPDGTLGGGRLAYAYLLAFSRSAEAHRAADLDAVARIFLGQGSPGLHDRPVGEVLLENAWFHAVATGAAALPPRAAETLDALAGGLELASKGLTTTSVRRLAAVAPDHRAFDRFDIRHVLTQSFVPSPAWVLGLAKPLADLGADVAPILAFAADLTAGFGAGAAEPSAESPLLGDAAALLGAIAERFADAVRAGFVVMPPMAQMLSVVGYRGDDPEWRVPIRATLARALRDPAAFARFAAQVPTLFDLVPRDLAPPALVEQHQRAPRAMWVRLVEFADRCGRMGALIQAVAATDPAVEEVATAYARWDAACRALLRERALMPQPLSQGDEPMTDDRNDQQRAIEDAIRQVDALVAQQDAGGDESTLEAVVDWGRYDGLPAQVALLADGRQATLLAPIAYHRPDRSEWPVPPGATLDGASIPRLFWTLIGGPFEGKYRDASIIHDHYCVTQDRPWADTHRMFHDAMRCSGVGTARARVMFYAVYKFGPRWAISGLESVESVTPQPTVSDADAQTLVRDAEAIVRDDLDLDAIQALADARPAGRG